MSAFTEPGNATEINIPPIKGLYATSANMTVQDSKIVLDIDKNAYLILKVPHLADLNIKYTTDSTFLLHYSTVIEPVYKLEPHMLFSKKIRKENKGVHINLRDTINWDYNSFPYFVIEGTGRLVLEQVSAAVVPGQAVIEKEKNRAFFWRPEQVRSMSMNFLTPVYWRYTSGYLWPDVLAIMFLVIAIPVTLISFLKRKDFKKAFTLLSIISVLIFNDHFLIRFMPIVNTGFYLPNQEKIKKYYFREEFGNIVAEARDAITASDKVVFMGPERDWFSKETLCFNIAPIPCVYYKPDSEKLAGLMDAYWINSSDVNVVVSYNSQYPLPSGFKKIFSQNKNTFIAKKE